MKNQQGQLKIPAQNATSSARAHGLFVLSSLMETNSENMTSCFSSDMAHVVSAKVPVLKLLLALLHTLDKGCTEEGNSSPV